MPRRIIYLPEFDEQARVLGGIRLIDQVLRPVIDALERNPRAFRVVETPWFRVRYATTRQVGNVPPLVVIFSIDEDDDVLMEWIEALAGY
jgi:hypothetical protein